MRQYQLGPNGAIMTSLNLFATRFDQVNTSTDCVGVRGMYTAAQRQARQIQINR